MATDRTTTVTDESIAAAIAKTDASTASKVSDNADDGEPSNVQDMVAAMSKHSDGTNVIKESIITFSNPDGSDKKGDRTVPTSEPTLALELLKEMVSTAKETAKPKKKAMWDFGTVPHKEFNKTLDETFTCFLLWARTNNNSNNGNGKDEKEGTEAPQINVSKAFRRLEHYAEWMQDTGTDLVEPALTPETVQEALEIFNMKVTVDKDGRVAWWFDFATMDLEGLKERLAPEDSLRAFVWFAHFIMYDANAQKRGILFVENVDKMGFLQMMTLFPMKLSTKLDRLTIGILPVKMNALYILDSPTWMNVFMKFMSLFMSEKMKKRIIFLDDFTKIEGIVGQACIPKGFGSLEGNVAVDLVEEKYFLSREA